MKKLRRWGALSAPIRQCKKISSTLMALGLPSIGWASIPTPPADLQMGSGQSFFKVLGNLIVEDVLPVVLPGAIIALLIYAIWGFLTALHEARKTGEWGPFFGQVILSAIAITLAGVIGYAAYKTGDDINVQS